MKPTTTAASPQESNLTNTPLEVRRRPAWRRRGVRLLASVVVITQVALVINGYRDPHNYFAFQPFNESSTYALTLERVLNNGQRIEAPNGQWEGYRWDDLVGWRALQGPWHQRHAFSGVDAVLDYLSGRFPTKVVAVGAQRARRVVCGDFMGGIGLRGFDDCGAVGLGAVRPDPNDQGFVWPIWLLRFEAAAIYFASGFSKLIDPDWVSGRVLHDRTLRYQDDAMSVLGETLGNPILEVLTSRTFHWVLSPMAVATELFIACGLWFRRTRLFAVWVAVAFHLGIEISAQVEVFSAIAIGALVIWVTPSTRDRNLITPHRWVKWLDWTARFNITVVPGSSWCVTDRNNTQLEGSAARSFVFSRLPATFLFSRFWRFR
ncbi:MAG: HTTM domain-containing protein [bacterium]|nr:HTTM domain-containing protein [bacterium]